MHSKKISIFGQGVARKIARPGSKRQACLTLVETNRASRRVEGGFAAAHSRIISVNNQAVF
jgi:hypothetical protein